jgi:Fur family zinc uptake transcriptional regulator
MNGHQHEGSNLTRNQSLVYETLVEATAPLSAYTILDALRDRGFRAPLQVYRALDKLVEFGMVHRLESLNAFVVCRAADCETHETTAFVICETCGRVTEITDNSLEKKLKKISKEIDFKLEKTIIELRGFCAACRVS